MNRRLVWLLFFNVFFVSSVPLEFVHGQYAHPPAPPIHSVHSSSPPGNFVGNFTNNASSMAPQQHFQSNPQGSHIDSSCFDCDSMSVSKAGFSAGINMLFAKPHFKESFRVSQSDFATGTMNLIPFDYGYELAPRAWFGFQNSEGLGVKASYWSFDIESQAQFTTNSPFENYGAHVVNTMFPANIFVDGPGGVLGVSDYLNTRTIDLLGTIDTELGSAEINAGAGLRYAKLRQGFAANGSGSGFFFPATSQLAWSREFAGLGPAVMLDARKRLGQSRFSAVASGGGSLLFGNKTIERAVVNDSSPNPTMPLLQLEDADEVVGIGELSLGIEYVIRLSNGQQLVTKGVYEGQLWAEAGAPTLGFLGFQGFGLQLELRR